VVLKVVMSFVSGIEIKKIVEWLLFQDSNCKWAAALSIFAKYSVLSYNR